MEQQTLVPLVDDKRENQIKHVFVFLLTLRLNFKTET